MLCWIQANYLDHIQSNIDFLYKSDLTIEPKKFLVGTLLIGIILVVDLEWCIYMKNQKIAWNLKSSFFFTHHLISTSNSGLNFYSYLVLVVNNSFWFKMFWRRHHMYFSARGLALDYFLLVKFGVIFTIPRLLFKPRKFCSDFLLHESVLMMKVNEFLVGEFLLQMVCW